MNRWRRGGLSLFTLPLPFSCVTLALGKSLCLVLLVVRGQEKPPSEVTWARYISQQTRTIHWTLTALSKFCSVQNSGLIIIFIFTWSILRKQWAELPQVTPRILKLFPKNRIPTGFLLWSCTLHFLVSCGSDAPRMHRALSCSLCAHFFSPPVLLCAAWVLICTCWAKVGVCWVCPGHLKGICDTAVELVGRKLCQFSSFATFFTSTVLQDVWHIFPCLITLLVVHLGKT